MENGYRLIVYKQDRRFKESERQVKSYDYPGYSDNAMMNEVKSLTQRLYKPRDGWRLEFEPMTVMVKSLMTGKMVAIDYRNRGGPCDPSMERYWSM